MSLTRCPFCEQSNSADAKFCNECGGALYLAPCPNCGAVNQVSAIACHQCRRPLQGRGTAAPVASLPTDLVLESSPIPILSDSLPVAMVPESRPRRASKIIIGTAAVVVVAGLGYNAYRQRMVVQEPQPRPVSSETVVPAGAGGPRAATAVAGPAAAVAAPAGAALLPAGKPPTHGVLDPSREAARPPAQSQKPRATTAAVARPQPASASKAGEQRAVRPEACTAEVAALGLCGAGVALSNETKKGGPAELAQARRQTAEAGKTAESPRPEACTEAAAALGLCPAEIPQRR